jgi:hypothetical protein
VVNFTKLVTLSPGLYPYTFMNWRLGGPQSCLVQSGENLFFPLRKQIINPLFLISNFHHVLLSSGLFPGACNLNANILEPSVCSIFIGDRSHFIPTRYRCIVCLVCCGVLIVYTRYELVCLPLHGLFSSSQIINMIFKIPELQARFGLTSA